MGGDTAEHQVSSAELEECRQEKDMYRDELNQQRMTVESLRTEIQVSKEQIEFEFVIKFISSLYFRRTE